MLKFRVVVGIAASMVILSSTSVEARPSPVGTAFTYQGLVKQGGTLVNDTADFQFSLFDEPSGGTQIGTTQAANEVDVVDGGFSVDIDFGADVFGADARWLDIGVRSPAGSGVFTPLTPRQVLRATPVAQFALGADGASIANINAANISSGTIAWSRMPNGGTWPLTAGMQIGSTMAVDAVNARIGIGTTSPSQALQVEGNVKVSGWIGTDIDQPVEIVANNMRAIRVEGAIDEFGQASPNIIGGNGGNSVAAGVIGATISGGGNQDSGFNRVNASYGFVGGGFGNLAGPEDLSVFHLLVPSFPTTVVGGSNNRATATGSTVVGGAGNTASGGVSTVCGGFSNTASGGTATVCGGHSNIASGTDSTLCGGGNNVASGLRSTVAGGFLNEAAGEYSFAAGLTATASHDGTFVWADSVSLFDPFESTAANQFLIRASGGVGIGTTAPGGPLHVLEGGTIGITPSASASLILERDASANYLQMIGTDSAEVGIMFGKPANGASGGIYYNSGATTPSGLNFRTNGNSIKMVVLDSGRVGIGTVLPDQLLTVNGNASKSGGGAWAVFSDARLKKNIQPLHNSLDQLLLLQGVSFEYIDPDSINEMSGTRIGMIAQDVEQIFPDWVSDTPRGYKSLSFSGFEALTVEALRDLRSEKDAEIAQLRAEKDAQISTQSRAIAAQAQRIAVLEGLVKQLLEKESKS